MQSVLLCLVVAISDGDTLKARCPDQQQTIRLVHIDAPEKRQPWGERSRQALAALCHQVEAEVRPAGVDRYGRMLAAVSCRGKDAGAEQVRAGMAWAFTRYKPGPELIRLEQEARAAGLGLWVDPAPVPPWEWRAALSRRSMAPGAAQTAADPA